MGEQQPRPDPRLPGGREPSGIPVAAGGARGGRRGGPWLLGLTVALVVAIGMVVAYHTTRIPDPAGAAQSASQQSAAQLAPSDAEQTPASTGPHPVNRLADNPVELDNLSLAPSTCVVPAYPSDNSGRAAFYEAAKSCLDAVWQPLLAAAQLPFSPAKLVLFGSSVGTPCGEGVQAEGAFYCDGSATIYVSPEKFSKSERVADSQTGVFLSVMAHEYGHHVQDLSGIFAEAGDRREKAGVDSPAGLEISRRTELQANCFAGMFFAAVTSRGSVTARTVRQAGADIAHRGDTKRGPADHGSFAHSGLWFQRGLAANNTSACNTWVAPAADVS